MATARQARLIDWFKHPQGVGIPHGPAIDYTMAMWSAEELVRHTGLYENRRQCLYDLNALRAAGVVTYGWRYVNVWEDIGEGVKVSHPVAPRR